MAGWRARLPFFLVVLSLAALVLVPILMDRRTQPLLDRIEASVEPARNLTAQVQAHLAYELSLVRAYLLTGDDAMLERYVETQQAHHHLYDQLAPLIERLDPESVSRFRTLRSLAEQRHAPTAEFVRGKLSREQFVADLPARQELFESALTAARFLDLAIQRQEQEYRAQIRELRQLNWWVTALLALVALGALFLVARMSRRLRRRAAEEMALRRVAHSMAGALEATPILRKFVVQALTLTRADAAFAECAWNEQDDVEIVAAAGTGAPEAGTRIAYPGSLSSEILKTGEPLLLQAVSSGDLPTTGLLERSCPGCSALVVPLIADEKVLGALVLLRSRGRSAFDQEAVQRACTLSSLASLTLRKIRLLEESERQRDELAHLLETRSRLIRGVSHDLKNPLGAADGYTELLETGVQGDLAQGQKEFVARIRRTHRSMLEIIQNLLEIARSDRGDLHITQVKADPADIARETAEDYRAAAELADLELIVDLPRDLPEVRTDPVRLREIIGNLLSNAVKYTPSGGRVRIGVREHSGASEAGPGPWVRLEVQDTGPGIPTEEQSQIFEEFHRLDGNEAGGSGIGLAVSRKMARALGGEITVESRCGEGSEFTLWLRREAAVNA